MRATSPFRARRATPDRLRVEPRFAPPAKVGKRRGADWRVVLPAGRCECPEPIAFGPERVDLRARAERPHGDLGVLRLSRGRLLGPHGWVQTPRGEIVNELTFHRLRTERLELPARELQVERLSGSCLSLATDWGRRNYGHFLLDGLGRWELFRRAGYEPGDFDHVYCGPPHPNAARILERLGIPVERLVRPRRRYAVAADTVFAASFPGRPQAYPAWVVALLRSAAPAPAGPRNLRLYLPRTTKRKVSNEQELLPILAELGFETYDPARRDDPPADFARAEAIVGAHGAALADIAFCQPGTRVLELLPSDHVHAYWFSVASGAELEYGYLLGTSTAHRPAGAYHPSTYDFNVDVSDFRRAAEWTVGGAPWR